jgi:hypothetical protein
MEHGGYVEKRLYTVAVRASTAARLSGAAWGSCSETILCSVRAIACGAARSATLQAPADLAGSLW